MDAEVRRQHWEATHEGRAPTDVSWWQARPQMSLDLITATGVDRGSPILDVGGGASTLVDHLLDAGYVDVTVLDVAEIALKHARQRLGPRHAEVHWIVGDVLDLDLDRRFAVWHDRAVFHFLVEANERARYVAAVGRSLGAGGQVILGTFGPSGPETCSGLPVMRHDERSMTAALGPGFEPVEFREEVHVTPGGARQPFVFGRFVMRSEMSGPG